MTRIWTVAIVGGLALAACEHLPPSVAPDGSGEQAYGTTAAATPLTTIVQEKHIRPLNPGSQKPLLDQAMTELSKTDPQGHYRGITYDLTKNNALNRDWLIQTPAAWGRHSADVSYVPPGRPAASRCPAPILSERCDCAATGGTCARLATLDASPPSRGAGFAWAVRRGHRSVLPTGRQRQTDGDITALQTPPTTASLRHCATGDQLARSGRADRPDPDGQYPPENDAQALLAHRGDAQPSVATSHHRVFRRDAVMRRRSSCGAFPEPCEIVATTGRHPGRRPPHGAKIT
jgi:hypothetical protein